MGRGTQCVLIQVFNLSNTSPATQKQQQQNASQEESEKVGLKLNIQKMKIIASGPITSWEIDRETVETVSDYIFWGAPKSLQMVIAAVKLRCLLLGRKVMTNLR